MVTGRVVRFDSVRGYGFIAPETGGDDVFLHVNDTHVAEELVRPRCEVGVRDRERRTRAEGVRGPPRPGHGGQAGGPFDDSLCDVLSAEEFLREVTEVLLTSAPSLTGEQILQARAGLARFAKGHGWTEG